MRLDTYLDLRQEIFDYFGYVEDWRVLPIDDRRGLYWMVIDESCVRYGETEEKVRDINNEWRYWEDEIYTQRHLKKWVYEGDDYTMILVDTHTDGNQFLAIYTNQYKLTEGE